MSRNYYSEINLHIVWHTKQSMPLLTPAVESETWSYLRHKLVSLPGSHVHEIGGTETHVHIALSVTPTILISDLIGQLKGASSHEINQKLGNGRKLLEWQAGYGVVSFGTGDLPWVIDYIRNQRQHHARGTMHDRLERAEQHESGQAGAVPLAQAEQREAP
jgi:putative transposase